MSLTSGWAQSSAVCYGHAKRCNVAFHKCLAKAKRPSRREINISAYRTGLIIFARPDQLRTLRLYALLQNMNKVSLSPCNRKCKLTRDDNVCSGCGRTIDEIVEWGNATAARQTEIAARASGRLTTGFAD